MTIWSAEQWRVLLWVSTDGRWWLGLHLGDWTVGARRVHIGPGYGPRWSAHAGPLVLEWFPHMAASDDTGTA